ncbi:endonuclease I [Candidatus Pacearchaeota archaeon]|nr:endonuclease I [Candidatus Pacearchaeota archaeon]
MAWGKKYPKRRVHPYAGCKMASKAEVKFAEWMDAKDIVWLYEAEKLDWIPPKRKYTPDFKVKRKDGSFFFVEYKGYLRPADKTKMKAIRQQYPDLDIRFVFQNARKFIYKGSKTTYGMWAEKNGYLWAEGTMPEDWMLETTPYRRP